jgi:hypothetical protein
MSIEVFRSGKSFRYRLSIDCRLVQTILRFAAIMLAVGHQKP